MCRPGCTACSDKGSGCPPPPCPAGVCVERVCYYTIQRRVQLTNGIPNWHAISLHPNRTILLFLRFSPWNPFLTSCQVVPRSMDSRLTGNTTSRNAVRGLHPWSQIARLIFPVQNSMALRPIGNVSIPNVEHGHSQFGPSWTSILPVPHSKG